MGKQEGRHEGALGRASAFIATHRAGILAAVTTCALTAPRCAWAIEAVDMLNKVINLLIGGVKLAGGGLIVIGAVSIGSNISAGASGNSSAINQGIMMVVGGVIIMAAAIFFGQLDTSWATTS